MSSSVSNWINKAMAEAMERAHPAGITALSMTYDPGLATCVVEVTVGGAVRSRTVPLGSLNSRAPDSNGAALELRGVVADLA